ncbi:sigma-70 family RNA polymerase sigma factor [Chloroflexota bacterium]
MRTLTNILYAQGNSQGVSRQPLESGEQKGVSRVQDEASLIELAKKHDEQALTMIYEENFSKIYRYAAIKVSDMMEAEDIAQQVFLKAVQSIGGYRHTGKPFSAWLYRIAHNLVVDHYRKKGKARMVEVEETIEDTATSVADTVEQKLRLEEVAQAAKKLTEAQQEVMALRFSSDLPIAEVAWIMGKSEGAVKALQFSAVQALRRHLAVS